MIVNSTEDINNIKQKAIKSVKWTALGEVVSRSIQPIVILILARLLTPSDFGVVGVAMIAIGLAQIFQDFGLGKTLIQRETEVEKSANIVFWTNLVLSIVLYLIIFLSAPLLSQFFHEPKVIDVLRILCLQIILFSLISVHQALFQRNFQFKQVFFIRLSSAIIPGLVSIPLALFGYGVWALVFGTLAGASVQLLLFWHASPWRPRLSYDFQLAKQLFGFSSWVVLEAFLGWLIVWGDSIVLGHFLGVKELGVYRVGVTFILLIFGFFFNPLLSVSYSAFSRLQDKTEELKQSFLKIIELMAVISIPLGAMLLFLSPSISSVLFGNKWEGIEIVIALIGIKDAIAWLTVMNSEVYRAIGRPDINSKLLIVSVIFFIPVYVYAAQYGLLVFCLSRLSLAIVNTGIHILILSKILVLPHSYFWRSLKLPLLASIVMIVGIYFVDILLGSQQFFKDWIKISMLLMIGGGIYTLSLWFKEKELVLQILRHLKASQ